MAEGAEKTPDTKTVPMLDITWEPKSAKEPSGDKQMDSIDWMGIGVDSSIENIGKVQKVLDEIIRQSVTTYIPFDGFSGINDSLIEMKAQELGMLH